MTAASPEPRGEEWYLLMTAATDEAARAGHGEVDADHVLLALLVAGGASTAILSDAGLRLGPARSALAEVQRADLAALGVSTPVPPPPAGHTYGAGTAALPWSDRASRALGLLIQGGPDSRVLAAVLADEHGPACRLLEQAGADPTHVRAAATLATARTLPPVEEPPTAGDARTWSSAHTRTVAVPRVDVWRVVRNPLHRSNWDDTVASVQIIDERTFETLDAVARVLAAPGQPIEDPGLTATHVVTDEREGQVVEWEVRYPSRGHTEWLRVELEDDGAATRLTLRHAFSKPRGLLALSSPLYAWTTGRQLKLLAQAIAQTAATD
jgi:hypothetical protein